MKHSSFFPFILLALTLILVTGFVFSASPKQTEQKSAPAQISTVTDAQYQTALSAVLKKFIASYDTAVDDTARSVIVDHTLSTLLSMRVPAGFKDLHLELAITLQKMKQGLISNPQDSTEGYAQIKDLISQTPGLHL